jgi:tetratricopeptide (TPR) repeat protein
MFPRTCFIALALFAEASLALAGPPRISFVRTIPAAHDIGLSSVALIYAIGDSDKIHTFVDIFVDHASRATPIENDTSRHQHLVGQQIDDATFRRIRREHPADLYLGINVFTCSLTERAAEGSERDVDGKRFKRRHVWADAVCSARLDFLSGKDGKRLFSFTVRGEGTSPRVIELTDEDRSIALDQAAHYAAIAADEAITPRTVRESIELDETAPAFDEALAMIDSSRFEDARAIWEAALPRHRDSAALHYDLGAICEVLGDSRAAGEHFQEAFRLAPKERRYRVELDLFRKRNAMK